MNVSRQELIIALAEKLKPILRKPEWADVVKTGMHKERPPKDSDWWFMRGASVLMKVDKLQPIGVSKLRRHYGGKKNRGVAPEHFYKGSGNILRKVLQQLEQAGLIKQDVKAGHKGRVITPKAVSLIAKTAKEVEKMRPRQKEEPKVVEAKKEEPVKVEHKKAEPVAEVKEEAKETKNEEPVKAERKKAEPAVEVKEEPKKEVPKAEPAGEAK
jgi:small subunit ribosomal protein S19e